jgi:hypothetical protein
MRKKDWEAVYLGRLKKERGLLKEFVTRCKEDADNLLYIYRHDKTVIPDDEYRAVAFFLNDEYADKPGALSALYDISQRLSAELPPVTLETVVEQLMFRFKIFNKILAEGGY